MTYPRFEELRAAGYRFLRPIDGHRAIFEHEYNGKWVVYDYIRDVWYSYNSFLKTKGAESNV